jgi:hypothetical protein
MYLNQGVIVTRTENGGLVPTLISALLRTGLLNVKRPGQIGVNVMPLAAADNSGGEEACL